MKSELTPKQKDFFEYMKQDENDARFGFQILIKKPNLLDYFKTINDEGYFTLEKLYSTGSFIYLEKAAIKAGETHNKEIANEIIGVIRQLSCLVSEKIDLKWHLTNLARLFSELPISVLSNDDIEIFKSWLDSPIERLAISSIGNNLLPRLLESEIIKDWDKALLIVKYFTEFSLTEENKLRLKIDNYSLKNIFLDQNINNFVKRYKKDFCDFLKDRLQRIFNTPALSWLLRPAIEEHSQNTEWGEIENIFVESFRNSVTILLAAQNDDEKKQYLNELLKDKAEIIRRVGFYSINQNFDCFHSSLLSIITNENFSDEAHLHELYTLLDEKFSLFTEDEKQHTYRTIKDLKNKEVLQLRWLSAIYKKGVSEADKLFEILRDKYPASILKHPSFMAYSKISGVNTHSIYTESQLFNFLNTGGC